MPYPSATTSHFRFKLRIIFYAQLAKLKGEVAIGIPSGRVRGTSLLTSAPLPLPPPPPLFFPNRPFPSSPGPLYQNEVKCSAFDMEMIFHSHVNKTHFHNKGCALGLSLKIRVFGTLRRPTEELSQPLDDFIFYFQNLWNSPSLILERRRHL